MQDIQFIRDASGAKVAYASVGEGPLVICPAWWVSHVERDWEHPAFRRFFERLAHGFRVVRYDRPGTGLSDRDVPPRTQAAEVQLLATLADALGESQFSLFAVSCAGPVALNYAATHQERVRRLCAKAKQPLQHDLIRQLSIETLNIQVGAVCVYHRFVETARRALEGTGVNVAAVSTGFPAGLSPMAERIAEIHRSVDAGAQEVDVVITRALVFEGKWQELYDEVSAFKQACGASHMKVILGTGDLLTLRNVARASFTTMMAGADFIKTSTGKEPTNATLPVGLVMTRAIREYAQETGMAVGFKPAGGIRTAKQSIEWLALMKEELGLPWMKADLFRFGASSLLNDIERQLEHHATGRYSADYRHPIA